MYREKPEESYYTNQHMFVDLDESSGGYPTRATMLNAHDFKTVQKAIQYDSHFNEFIVAKLVINGVVSVEANIEEVRNRREQYMKLKKEFDSD